jgi:hypothetical protein
MARPSYFGRMVRGGGVAPLTPPRPVANLWKSARLDWVKTDSAPEGATQPASMRTHQSSPAAAIARPALLPIVPPRPQNRAKNVPVPVTVAASVPKERAVPRVAELKPAMHANQAAPGLRTELRTASTELPNAPSELQPQAVARRRTPAPAPVEHPERDQPPQQVSVSRQTSAEERLTDPAAQPPMHLEPMRLTMPSRPERTAPAQSQARSEQRNTIQIGRIEVQVVSPPAVVQRAAPAAPTTRLARGYTLWSSW